MPRLLLLLLALGASACDFTPSIDIATPPFEPALTVNTVLFADSTARVKLTRARDPYAPTSISNAVVSDAAVTLQRDGGPSETLVYQPRRCSLGYDYETGEERVFECGLYVSAAPVVGGSAYTLRAEAPGLPPVEATAQVPARVPATATAEDGPPNDGRPTRRLTLRLQDPPGDTSYGLDVLVEQRYTQSQVCDARGCRDSTYTARFSYQTSFVTTDAILLAGLRGIPGRANFVTFTDRLFADQTRSFTLDAIADAAPEGGDERLVVRLIAFDGPLVQAYEQAYFSLGEDNPFQEPFDPVSNVRGGFGLVGAAAVTEIPLGALRR